MLSSILAAITLAAAAAAAPPPEQTETSAGAFVAAAAAEAAGGDPPQASRLPRAEQPSTLQVINQCESSVYLTIHSNGEEGRDQGRFEKEGNFGVQFEEGTHELRVAQTENPYEAGAPITGLVYNLKGDELKYDIYNLFDFTQPSISVDVEGDDECEGVKIDNEEDVQGVEMRKCKKDAILTLTLCPKEADM